MLQWQREDGASVAYMVYRWIFAAIFCCGLLASLFDIGRETSGLTYLKWPVYLTNWGYTVCTIQAIMAAYHVTQYYNSSKGLGNIFLKYVLFDKFLSNRILAVIICSHSVL